MFHSKISLPSRIKWGVTRIHKENARIIKIIKIGLYKNLSKLFATKNDPQFQMLHSLVLILSDSLWNLVYFIFGY